MAGNRKRQLKEANLFSGNDPDPLLEADEALYGSQVFARVDSQRYVAEPLSIFRIWPDARQPRRTLPSVARAVWNGSPERLSDAFTAWLEVVEAERGKPLDVVRLLNAEEEVERLQEPRPFEVALMELVDLAASIRHEGLTNPITVTRKGSDYQLETGERRWLAFHLLYALTQEEQWSRMPARIVDESSVWRQASENNVRNDLNAIGRARQFAILLMSMYGFDKFKGFDELVQPNECDRAFYAQVANGSDWRVPRGRGEMMLNAMSLKHINQLGYYRALLRLPDVVWQIADDLNWTENFIRDFRIEANDEEQIIKLALKKAREQGYTPTGVVVEDIPNITTEAEYPPPPPPETSPKTGNLLATGDDRRKLRRLMQLRQGSLGNMALPERSALLQEIEDLRVFLDHVESLINDSDNA